MIGVRFKPFGLASFIRFDALDLHNQVIDADLVWGNAVHHLREQLFAANSVLHRFHLVEGFLQRRLQDIPTGLEAVAYGVHQLRSEQVTIRDLSDDIGWSQKHLTHQFKKYIGVSPKSLARLFRFQDVLHAIHPNTNWVDIALACGYYDQAHFNHEFAAFTGLSPSQYIDYRQMVFDDVQDWIHFVPAG
jgi:AraC-like DNA-binding protein